MLVHISLSHNTAQRVVSQPGSRQFVYNGNWYYPCGGYKTLQDIILPSPGWTIDPTMQPTITVVDKAHGHGKHSQGIISVSPQQVVVQTSVWCHDGHDIGIVSFVVNFRETQIVTDTSVRQQPFALKWFQQILLEPRAGESILKMDFHSYYGVDDTFGAPTMQHRILRIRQVPSGWEVYAVPPKTFDQQ